MARIEKFEDLEIWQTARDLNRFVKLLVSKESMKKEFAFNDQIKRAAGSTMDNIAEGFGRGGNKEFKQYLSITNGSVNEVKSQLYRAYDFEYISKEEFQNGFELADKLSRKTIRFMSYLNSSSNRGPKFIEN